MPVLEPIRTAASAASRLSGPTSSELSRTSSHTTPRRQLTHVHSFHLDDQGYYHDDLHDEYSEDELEAGRTDGAADQLDSTTPDETDDSFAPESAQNEASGAATADLEKAISRKSLKRRNTSRSGKDKDPNIVDWDGPDDPSNPKNWTKAKKWQATFIVSCFTFISPVSSSMIAPAAATVLEEFGVTNAVFGQMIISIFVLAYAVGPLFLAPLSETFGRVRVLQLANLVFLVFNTACGASTSAGMMIAFRFLAGLGGSAPLVIGGGVLSDAWLTEERGAAIALYSLMPLLGPAVGPIAGGFITQQLGFGGWRWVFYSCSIADALIQVMGIFFLTETYPPEILKRKLRRLRKETGNHELRTAYDDPDKTFGSTFRAALLRPFRMLFTQVVVLALACYMAFLYGTMYLLLSTFPALFGTVYGESVGVAGLNYLSLGLGFGVGSQCSARLQDRTYKYLRDTRGGGKGRPEFRTPLMVPGSILIPAGLFLYGWSAEYRLHWIVPNIGAFLFSAGTIICFQGIQTYVVDTYTRYAASAIGAVTVLRSTAGFGFPLFAPAMYHALGYGWGNSLLGFMAILIGIPAPWLLWRYGESLRARSTFAAG